MGDRRHDNDRDQDRDLEKKDRGSTQDWGRREEVSFDDPIPPEKDTPQEKDEG